MRARGWVLAAAAVLVVGLALPATAEKPTMSAVGSVWFFVPPIPGIAPNGADGHFTFSVRSNDDGASTGNASLCIFDGVSGKLMAVLTGKNVWYVHPEADGIRFWVQLELKEGSIHPMVLMPLSWWVSDGGDVDEVMFHALGLFEVLRGNVTVHGL